MKLNYLTSFIRREGETIATFGEAQLVKQLDGKLELIGGSSESRTAAKEWVSLFLHEAVITVASNHEPRSSPLRARTAAF